MDKLKQVAEGYKDYSEGHGPVWIYLLIAAAVIGALVGLGYLLQHLSSNRERAARRRVFRRFAEASGLEEDEAEFLLQLAERGKMDNLARIFVERSVFEVGAPALGWDRTRLEILRGKVYGP